MPFGLTSADARDVAAFLIQLVRTTYASRRRDYGTAATKRPDTFGDDRLPRWDGGYDWRGRYHTPVWARITGAALERGFDVEDYVKRAFDHTAAAGSPYPNKLLSTAALEHYERTYLADVVHRLRVNRYVMNDQMAREISGIQSIGGVRTPRTAALVALQDLTNSLRPFYRYWVVAQFDHEDPDCRRLREAFHRPALIQYASSCGRTTRPTTIPRWSHSVRSSV